MTAVQPVLVLESTVPSKLPNLLFLDKSDTGERLGVSTRYLFELILGGLQFGV